MSWTIFLSVCSLTMTGVCQDLQFQVEEKPGQWLQLQKNCSAASYGKFLEWSEHRQGWKVDRWKCKPLSKKETDA